MKINVAFDEAKFRVEMQKRAAEVRKAQRYAVNELAKRAVVDLRDAMDRVFDRPTPWVRNGFRAVFVGETITSSMATREEDRARARAIDAGTDDIVATVEWKAGSAVEGEGAKSISAESITRAQVEGGPRRLKRFERALIAIGAMPDNVIAVPAKGARLDRYGNLSGATIGAILSDLRAYTRGGQQQNRAATARKYFAVPQQTNRLRLPPGIYQNRATKGGKPKLIIAFVRPGNYQQRLNPRAVIEASVKENAPQVWQAELARLRDRWES